MTNRVSNSNLLWSTFWPPLFRSLLQKIPLSQRSWKVLLTITSGCHGTPEINTESQLSFRKEEKRSHDLCQPWILAPLGLRNLKPKKEKKKKGIYLPPPQTPPPTHTHTACIGETGTGWLAGHILVQKEGEGSETYLSMGIVKSLLANTGHILREGISLDEAQGLAPWGWFPKPCFSIALWSFLLPFPLALLAMSKGNTENIGLWVVDELLLPALPEGS